MPLLPNSTAAGISNVPAWFRERAAVLSPELLQKIARCYVAVAVLAYVADLLQQTRDGLTNGAGRPLGDDFIDFWSGAYLAWHQRATEVYDGAAFHAFQQSVVGLNLNPYHYSYPPTLLVLTAPLALLPYVPALALWISTSWYAFYRTLRAAMPEGRALLFALATPAVFVNAIGGQNGTWTAALFGGGLSLLEKRPFIAGGLLGLLIYKPHLGILIPVALVAGRRWQAFAAAAAMVAALIAASLIWFGPDIFNDYTRQLVWLKRGILEDGTGVWHRMLSVFVAARRLGADVATAYLMQAISAGLAGLAVAAVWFRGTSAGARNAALVLGTCLATPYLQDYDLVVGAMVVLWLASDAGAGFAAERPLFFANTLILLAPLLAAALARVTGLAFGPLFILPGFAIAIKNGLACPQKS